MAMVENCILKEWIGLGWFGLLSGNKLISESEGVERLKDCCRRDGMSCWMRVDCRVGSCILYR